MLSLGTQVRLQLAGCLPPFECRARRQPLLLQEATGLHARATGRARASLKPAPLGRATASLPPIHSWRE